LHLISLISIWCPASLLISIPLCRKETNLIMKILKENISTQKLMVSQKSFY
jgi:hypothetical protein